MERLELDLLFRWFVGVGVDKPVWGHSTFSKNRDRLLAGEIAAKFLTAILERPRVRRLLSSDHFSVDGDGRNGLAAFLSGGEAVERTRASTTDPDAMLYKKGPGMEAKLCFIDHGLMENRSGLLLVDARLARVSGHAERLVALDMIEPFADRSSAITLGADRGYDADDFVEELRTFNVRPHVAQNVSRRRSAIDGRTIRHAGYAASIRARKRIEEAFGWIKTIGGLHKAKLRGLVKVDWAFTSAAAAYNLIRPPKLFGAPA